MESSAAAGGGADVDLHLTGSASLNVTGNAAGAFCAYYFPTEQRGVSIQATSADLPGTGTWSLHVQGDSTTETGLLIAIDGKQFSGNNGDDPASGDEGGTITVSDDVQHAEFDMQLVNITDHRETVHATGSVTCA